MIDDALAYRDFDEMALILLGARNDKGNRCTTLITTKEPSNGILAVGTL